MKALTLWQPWASFIAHGLKRYETRSWGTSYRGPIAIHAARRPIDDDGRWLLGEYALPQEPPLGAIVAIATLGECFRMSLEACEGKSLQERDLGNWDVGRYAWRMDNVQRFAIPIPARGAQGLWEWTAPQETLQQTLARLVHAPVTGQGLLT